MAYPGATTFPGPTTFPGSLPNSGGIFRTPYVQRRVPVIPPLTALINYSLAVLRINGQWVETEWPTEEQVNAADLYFPGGAENVVDPATAGVLIAAGYTVDIAAPPVAPPEASSLVGDAVVGVSTVG